MKRLLKYRVVFAWRGFSWIFLRNWYSVYRWTHPFKHFDGETVRLIDIGMFSLGYGIKN